MTTQAEEDGEKGWSAREGRLRKAGYVEDGEKGGSATSSMLFYIRSCYALLLHVDNSVYYVIVAFSTLSRLI